jgi:archaellum component FlaF (FlaF/FlaG flagellin family)
MKHSGDILNELQELNSSLADLPKVNPFLVPEGYFESLPVAILDEVGGKMLFNNKLNITYSIPANYFNGLADHVMTAIALDEEASLVQEAPILFSLDKRQVYSVPEGYFAQEIAIPAEAKVVSMKKGYRRFMQYAAAAMVSGLLVMGAFMYTDSGNYTEHEKTQQAVELKANEPVLNKETTDNEVVNEEQAEETTVEISKPATEKGIHDFTKKIQLLSAEEMQKYLEENAIPEPIQPESTQVILEDTTGI